MREYPQKEVSLQVGRDDIPGSDEDRITGDQIGDGNADPRSVLEDGCFRDQFLLQQFGRISCLVFLKEVQDNAGKDDNNNNYRIGDLFDRQ
jgi:hypothetical protein